MKPRRRSTFRRRPCAAGCSARRRRLREALAQEMDVATQDVFGFDGARCDRIVRTVLERIAGGACIRTR